MPSKTVEFRYLQVITNHLPRDRWPGALGWQRASLRLRSGEPA